MELKANMTMLELKQVSKSYRSAAGELKILDKLDFSLNEGEVCAVVGYSGSGKSTLLQVSGLLDSIDEGQIIINGIDYSAADDYDRTLARRSKLGFVYQFHHLLPEFTAFENLLIPQLINGIKQSTAKDNSMAMLKAFGLEHRAGHIPAKLSGGEQQRVAIARAVINQPKLLLADELTGNLDPENASSVINLLIKMSRALKLTVLLVTHNWELARQTDRIMLLKKGKLLNESLNNK